MEGPAEFAPRGITINGSGTARMLTTVPCGSSASAVVGCASDGAFEEFPCSGIGAVGTDDGADDVTKEVAEDAGDSRKSEIARSQPGWVANRTTQ